jgi:hypothetical protein
MPKKHLNSDLGRTLYGWKAKEVIFANQLEPAKNTFGVNENRQNKSMFKFYFGAATSFIGLLARVSC